MYNPIVERYTQLNAVRMLMKLSHVLEKDLEDIEMYNINVRILGEEYLTNIYW